KRRNIGGQQLYIIFAAYHSFMESVVVNGKQFVISIPESRIQERVRQIAAKMNEDLKGTKPVFLCVLKGSLLFASDVFREINMEAEISFIRVSSYSGTQSTGMVRSVAGIADSLEGRTVVILEDIVDTGDTAVYLVEEINKHNPERVLFASLLFKPAALRQKVNLDYVGFEVPNDFLVGYGLDYDGLGRNLKDIYKLA
ncbi:MAG: hypoxanthine phosphoribosyltransferase, partial [Bacteroidia bacterium]